MKKRQAEADSNKATQAKAKKANSSARTTPQKTATSAQSEPQGSTSIAAETRKKIEALIEERNFFSAEAQINQALKRNNSQHELYLYLLDIHILQKDEFAISQLLSHVRSLNIDDILAQAEAKKKEYESQAQRPSTNSSNLGHVDVTQTASSTTTADFDALMDTSAKPKAEFNFDNSELKSNINPKEAAPPLEFNLPESAKTSDEKESKTIDFASFSLEKNNDSQAATETHQPLDFPSAKPQEQAQPKTEKEELKPLDFGSLSLEPTPATQTENVAPQIEISQPVVEAAKAEEEFPTLNFSLDSETPTAVVEAPAPSLNVTPTLDFSLASEEKVEDAAPIIDLSAETKTEEQIQPLDFSFSLDKPVAETSPQTITDAPTLDFKLDHFSTDSNTTAEPSALDFNLNAATAVVEKPTMIEDAAPVVAATTSIDENDPLVKSFPELIQTNEISLNLDLAQQYIQLGAYDAARELLAEKDAEYSAQQRQQADQLLNQIAS